MKHEVGRLFKRSVVFCSIAAGSNFLACAEAIAGSAHATIVCVAGKPWLSFSTGVPSGATPGMVWVGAVNSSDKSVGFSLIGSMWNPVGGMQAAWQVYPNGLQNDSVIAPAVYSGWGIAGSPLPTYAQLLAFDYMVGYGLLPPAADDALAATNSAYATMAQIPARRALIPPPPTKDEMGANNVAILQQAHDQTGQARMQAIGAQYAASPANFKGQFAKQLSNSQGALDNPSSVPLPAPPSAQQIQQSYIQQDLIDNQRVITVTIGPVTDANRGCIKPDQ